MLSGALRDRALPLAAVGLALLGLAVGQGGDGPRRLEVVVAARSIAAGTPIPPDAIRLVSIVAADRTPSMLARIDEAAYRQSGVPLRAGDYVVRGALHNDDRAALQRERSSGDGHRAGHIPQAVIFDRLGRSRRLLRFCPDSRRYHECDKQERSYLHIQRSLRV